MNGIIMPHGGRLTPQLRADLPPLARHSRHFASRPAYLLVFIVLFGVKLRVLVESEEQFV